MEGLTTAASLLFVAGVGVTVALSQWIVAIGSTVLVPVLLGMPPFALLTTPEMQPIASGSLMGHVLYGLILGASYVWLQKRIAITQPSKAPEREYAYREMRRCVRGRLKRRSSAAAALLPPQSWPRPPV